MEPTPAFASGNRVAILVHDQPEPLGACAADAVALGCETLVHLGAPPAALRERLSLVCLDDGPALLYLATATVLVCGPDGPEARTAAPSAAPPAPARILEWLDRWCATGLVCRDAGPGWSRSFPDGRFAISPGDRAAPRWALIDCSAPGPRLALRRVALSAAGSAR